MEHRSVKSTLHWYWSKWTSNRSLWSPTLCIFNLSLTPFKSDKSGRIQAEKYRSFSRFSFCVKHKPSCMFSPKSDFISRFPQQGLAWAPRWVPMLGVSCVDQWADLIWADPSDALLSPFFADAHSCPIGHPGEPLEACVSILLTATNTYTTAVLSPVDLTAVKTKSRYNETVSRGKASWCLCKLFCFLSYRSKNKNSSTTQLCWLLPIICSHLCWLSLTFILTLAPLGVVGLEPLSLKSY